MRDVLALPLAMDDIGRDDDLTREGDIGSDGSGRDDMPLVEAARRDTAAFGALYERYRDRVYWYLLTRTRDPEDAADLLQQVFLRAFDAFPRYRPRKGPFAGWLFAIARNAAINFHHRQRATVAWDLVPEALRTPLVDDLEAGVLRREAVAQLRTAFATLDEDKRELLVLRFVAGLTAAEIAAVIGKGEAATKKSLSRTMQTLKERYHETP